MIFGVVAGVFDSIFHTRGGDALPMGVVDGVPSPVEVLQVRTIVWIRYILELMEDEDISVRCIDGHVAVGKIARPRAHALMSE